MTDDKTSRRPPRSVAAAIALMTVYCTGFLVLQLLVDDGCSANNNCDGFGFITAWITGAACIGVVVNAFLIYCLAQGHEWARVCLVGYYGFVVMLTLWVWPLIGTPSTVVLVLGIPWSITIIVLLVCRSARDWTAAAAEAPPRGGV